MKDIHQGSNVPHTPKSLNIGEYWEAALPKTAIAEENGLLVWDVHQDGCFKYITTVGVFIYLHVKTAAVISLDILVSYKCLPVPMVETHRAKVV